MKRMIAATMMGGPVHGHCYLVSDDCQAFNVPVVDPDELRRFCRMDPAPAVDLKCDQHVYDRKVTWGDKALFLWRGADARLLEWGAVIRDGEGADPRIIDYEIRQRVEDFKKKRPELPPGWEWNMELHVFEAWDVHLYWRPRPTAQPAPQNAPHDS